MSRSPGRSRPQPGQWGDVSLQFTDRELLDLLVAWVALSLAFAIFFAGGAIPFATGGPLRLLAISGLSAGVGFLLHELAHKVTAVHFDTPAQFRADYSMLGLAVMASLAGFLFAAPGAVYHPQTANQRRQGLVALAGPVVNVALALLFVPLAFVSVEFVAAVGNRGAFINLLLAGFNMLPFGPLDGRKVLDWNKLVFAVVAVPTIGLGVVLLFGLF